jgi:hypothetical protein
MLVLNLNYRKLLKMNMLINYLLLIYSLTFKDDKQVTLFRVVKPERFNDDEHVTALLNVVYPVTYNKMCL